MDLAADIETLEKRPTELDQYFKDGLETFKSIISGNPQYSADIDGAMKSNNLDSDIDRYLHQGKATSVTAAAVPAEPAAKTVAKAKS